MARPKMNESKTVKGSKPKMGTMAHEKTEMKGVSKLHKHIAAARKLTDGLAKLHEGLVKHADGMKKK